MVKKKIYLCNSVNEIKKNKNFFAYDNHDNFSTFNNLVDIQKLFSLNQKSWLKNVDKWHSSIYLRNINISWRWALTKAARLEYVYPHHLKPLLTAAIIINYLKSNDDDISLLKFPAESLSYINESINKNKFEIVGSYKKIYPLQLILSETRFYIMNLVSILSLFYKKLKFINIKTNEIINPDLLVVSNTISTKVIEEKGDHFFGNSFDIVDKKKINWFYILDDYREGKKISQVLDNKKKNYVFHLNHISLFDIFKILIITLKDIHNFIKFKNNIYPIKLGHLTSKLFYKNFVNTSLNNGIVNELAIFYSIKNYLSIVYPKNIIYPFEKKGFENAILKIVQNNKNKINTIGFAHALYSNRHRYLAFSQNKSFYFPDKLATTGSIPLKFFYEERNWPENRCFIFGSPRNFTYMNETNKNEKKRKTILIVLSDYYYELEIITNWILSDIESYKNYDFIIRPYPHDRVDAQRICIDKLRNSKLNININPKYSLKEQIELSDIVLFNQTSAGIEAMLTNCFVIRFSADDIIELHPKNEFGYNNKCNTVSSSKKLLEELNHIDNISLAERILMVENQNKLAQEIYSKVKVEELFKYD